MKWGSWSCMIWCSKALGPSSSTISDSVTIEEPTPTMELYTSSRYLASVACTDIVGLESLSELTEDAPPSVSSAGEICIRGSEAKAGGPRLPDAGGGTIWFPNTFFSRPLCHMLDWIYYMFNSREYALWNWLQDGYGDIKTSNWC